MKAAQLSIELLPFMTLAFLLLLLFLLVVSQHLSSIQAEREQETLLRIAKQLHEEVRTASSVRNGYSRSFMLPLTIGGKPYTVSIVNNATIIAHTSGYQASTTTFHVTGQPVPGQNTIRKNNGIISIN